MLASHSPAAAFLHAPALHHAKTRPAPILAGCLQMRGSDSNDPGAGARETSVKRCTELSQFLPELAAHKHGLLLPRPLSLSPEDQKGLQNCVERVVRRLHDCQNPNTKDKRPGLDVYLAVSIPFTPGQVFEIPAPLLTQIEEMIRADFPSTIVGVVMDDVKALCAMMNDMTDSQECNAVEVKLELIGENACRKWHYDNFVGRSIVTYSGLGGTTFCDDPARTLQHVLKVGPLCSAESAQVSFVAQASHDVDVPR